MSKKKNGFPTPYTILFLLMVLMALLTYIIPTGKYDYKTQNTGQIILAEDVASYSGDERILPIPGTYKELPSHPLGIGDVLIAPIDGVKDAIDIILFILCIGAFITVTVKTGAIDASFSRIIKKYEGREKFMIPLLIFLFSLGGTAFGMAEETVAFYPLLIPIMLRAGFDSFVGIAVILVGSVMGLLGAIINPFSVGIASGFAGTSIGDGIALRVLMFITANITASWFILRYAAKIEKQPSASFTYENKVEIEEKYLGSSKDSLVFPEFTPRRKVIMGVFTLTFLILIWGILPWDKFGLPNLYLGWWFNELAILFLVSSVIIGVIGNLNEKEIISGITQGASDFISVGLVIGMARAVTIIMDRGMLKDTILHFAESSISSQMGPIALALIVFVIFVPLAFFITSSSGLATVTMPIMTPVAHLAGLDPSFVVTIYIFSMGLLSMINPTDGILNAAITMSGSTYKKWFQFIFPLFLIMLGFAIFYIIVGSFIYRA